MEIISLTKDNLEKEQICCAISSNKDCQVASIPKISEQGFVLYYTNQCPFTAKYVRLIENVAKQKGISFKSILIETTEQAQNAPAPFTTYSLFYNSEFLTNEILSEKKFEKILIEKGL